MEERDNFNCISILLWILNIFFFIIIGYYTIEYYEYIDADENYSYYTGNTISNNNSNTNSNSTTGNTTGNQIHKNHTSGYTGFRENMYHVLYINIYTISCYFILYLGLSCIIFRHFIGILLSNLFYISIIGICYINYMVENKCSNRFFLSCDNNSYTSHSNITETRDILIYFVLASILFNILFSGINSICNIQNKKYYVNNFIFIETIVIFIGYYVFSLYFLLYPLLCCIGCKMTYSIFSYIINGRELPHKNFDVIA